MDKVTFPKYAKKYFDPTSQFDSVMNGQLTLSSHTIGQLSNTKGHEIRNRFINEFNEFFTPSMNDLIYSKRLGKYDALPDQSRYNPTCCG